MHQICPTCKDLEIHHLCADTRCSLDDLPGMMDNRDRWWERVWELHALNIMILMFVDLFMFYCISTLVGYLMPNPVYTYISNIYNSLRYFIDNIFRCVWAHFFFNTVEWLQLFLSNTNSLMLLMIHVYIYIYIYLRHVDIDSTEGLLSCVVLFYILKLF